MSSFKIFLFCVALGTNLSASQINFIDAFDTINNNQPYVRISCEKKENDLHFTIQPTESYPRTPACSKFSEGLLLVMTDPKNHQHKQDLSVTLSEINPAGSNPRIFAKATTTILPMGHDISMLQTIMGYHSDMISPPKPHALQKYLEHCCESSTSRSDPKVTAKVSDTSLIIEYHFPRGFGKTLFVSVVLHFDKFPDLSFTLNKKVERTGRILTIRRIYCSKDHPNGFTTDDTWPTAFAPTTPS